MTLISTLDAFPRRPIVVRSGWRTRLSLAGSALAVVVPWVVAIWFAVIFGPGLLADPRVWREGRSVPVTNVEGSCFVKLSLLPFSWCTLEISYEGFDGTEITRSVTAMNLGGFDSDEPPIVKIDPADEDTIALSWFVDSLVRRWLALALALPTFAVIGGVIGSGLWVSLREWRLYRLLAQHPNPVAVRVLNIRLLSNPGWAREVTFSYSAPDGCERTAKQRLKVIKGKRGVAPANWDYEEPITLCEPAGALMALTGDRGARLVKASFEPLVLTDAEKQRLRTATA